MCSTNVSPANVLPSLLLRTSPCRSPRRHPRRCSAATGIVIAIEFKLCTPFGRKLYFFAFDEYNLASNRYSVQRTPPPASDEAPYSSRPGHCLLAFQSFKRRPAHPSSSTKKMENIRVRVEHSIMDAMLATHNTTGRTTTIRRTGLGRPSFEYIGLLDSYWIFSSFIVVALFANRWCWVSRTRGR